jgi:LPS export ABC transporter protein LptC
MKKFIIIVLALSGCGQKEHTQPIEYEGPLQEAEQIELLYTENQKIKVRMTAPLLYEFKTGDREFPKGIYLEFYDEEGTLSSILKANHAYYFKTENKWRARGKVEVVNQEKNEQLSTEELFWFPTKEEINTESFVTIRMQTEVIYGEGLEAKQDMSSYVIKKPQGEFQIEEEGAGEARKEQKKEAQPERNPANPDKTPRKINPAKRPGRQ